MSLFIHDWEIVSPMGVGKEIFIKSINTFSAENRKPAAHSTLFENFDRKDYLGKKGVRNMDELGAYATVASQLLKHRRPELFAIDTSRIGVILGTGTGSIKSQIEFIQDLHIQEQVEWVNPIQFPQTVMNCAAGQVSIWNQFTGINTTVSSGYHSGISALMYATNALTQSRVDRILVGCAEEYSTYSCFLFPVDERNLRNRQMLGEGCALFFAGNQRLTLSDVEIISFKRFSHFNHYTPLQRIEALVPEVKATLDTRNISLKRICFNRFSSLETEIAQTLSQRLPANSEVILLCSNDFVGDPLSATAGLQTALLLAQKSPSADVAYADLVLTFDPAGRIAISILIHEETL